MLSTLHYRDSLLLVLAHIQKDLIKMSGLLIVFFIYCHLGVSQGSILMPLNLSLIDFRNGFVLNTENTIETFFHFIADPDKFHSIAVNKTCPMIDPYPLNVTNETIKSENWLKCFESKKTIHYILNNIFPLFPKKTQIIKIPWKKIICAWVLREKKDS